MNVKCSEVIGVTEKISNNKQSSERFDDHFTRLMFGLPRQISDANTESNQSKNTVENTSTDHHLFTLLENIDYDELMKNIHVFINSTKGLKPIVKKFSPLIERFLSQSKDN